MFSCEFCEISKNTFFHRTPLVAASEERYYKDSIASEFHIWCISLIIKLVAYFYFVVWVYSCVL